MDVPPRGPQQGGRACRTAGASAALGADATRRPPARTVRRSSCEAGRAALSTTSARARRPHPPASRSSCSSRSSCCSRRCCRFPPHDRRSATPARRRALHRGLDDLRHRADRRSTSRRTFSPFGKVDHLRRREHRRNGRADARLDPRARDLQATGPAGQAHRGERHQPAALARRSGQRGPDRAPRRGRPAAADGRAVDPRDRGRHRAAAVPLAAHRGHRPARGAVGSAVLRRDGVHQHRLHAQRRRARAVRRRLPAADGADDRRLPRLDRLPGDLHAVEALLARAPLDAAREAHPHHHGRCSSSPARPRSSPSSSTTPRRSDR